MLSQNGYRMELLYSQKGRDAEQYLSVFHSSATRLEDLAAEPDMVVIHRIWDTKIAANLLERYGSRVALLVHDHELYCPRTYYYTPFGRTNCSRAYSPLRCGLCGSMVSPRHWNGGLTSFLRRKFKDFKEKYDLAHSISSIIVLSEFMRDNLVRNGFAQKQIHVIPPFVESVEAHGKFCPDGRMRILFLGQLIRGKGADLMIDALSRMESDYEAVIAGDGNDKPMLEELAKGVRHGVIRFAGWVSEPAKLFSEADVLVFPSRWQEPFGLSGIEAMSHGVPVAGFSVGGVGEWLMDGQTGFAVAAGDAAALASALDRMAGSPEMLAEMSSKCLEFTKRKFSPANYVKNIERLLEVAAQ